MTARLKVLHVFKGTAPSEIVYQYFREPDPPKYFEQPEWTRLKEGVRYRFFLVPRRSGDGYENAIPLIDSSNEVEVLCADEPDDSPSISTEEARKLANTFALQHGMTNETGAFNNAVVFTESVWRDNRLFPGGAGTFISVLQQRPHRIPYARTLHLCLLDDRTVIVKPGPHH